MVRSILLLTMLVAVSARAEEPQSVLKNNPAAGGNSATPSVYESVGNGIAFTPPPGTKEIRHPGADLFVEFIDDARGWTLSVRRMTLKDPLPLSAAADATGRAKEGALEQLASQYRLSMPAAKFLRQDVTTFAKRDMGLLALRYTKGTGTYLTQAAVLRATDFSDRVYFVLEFTTPGQRTVGPVGDDDPAEKQAVGAFTTLLDSIKVLDRAQIRTDQDQRLLRTRALFVAFTDANIRAALIPQQWFRLIRDGKDIGYSYIVEETGKRDGFDGILIGIASRTVPTDKLQINAESWLFTTTDRRHESFSNLVRAVDSTDPASPKINHSTELGISDRRTAVKPVPDEVRAAAGNKGNKGVRMVEEYSINVNRVSKMRKDPQFSADLPPYYIPQAISHLLPRLIPLQQPKTYLFAVYISEQSRVMMRYIDVGTETTVDLGGKTVSAIPIKDRIGLEGSVTTHYMSPGGVYLGSVNADSKILLLPSTAEALTRLWQDAKITRPAEVEAPK